ncbi:hypothetical protein [Aquimarina sp. 2201CG14-23]|uniref:hypothetical protein n=1 Tax=Aquimarina mycalae TaxID=3040073 RepID=UPI002477E29E|nr:hypothetical protein [Aquimarina sp. 2201CG14-23]MDH7447587.1 hypothetical protein [Aquimarina sp. 2201CG14-23]
MYIIGEILDANKLKTVYAVFEDKKSVETYNKEHQNEYQIITIDTIFPFFFIEEFNTEEKYYQCITKDELEKRIQKIKSLNPATFVYFNLWRIDESMYNKDFPNEPILRGVDFHIHFTDTDIKEIESKGFDAYWDDIRTA